MPASRSARTLSPGKSLLKRLRCGAGALLLRNGAWHVLTPDGAGERRLAAKTSPVVVALISAGALARGDDGLYRPVAAAVLAVRNAQENPLHRLLASAQDGAGRFEREHLLAAERLLRDYEKAHLSPRLTTNYDPSPGHGTGHWQMSDNAITRLSDEAIAARQRLHLALEAVGPELSGVMLKVCCLVSGLEEAERALELPRRSARAILLLALTRLARHYGLKQPLRHMGPQRIGHWAVADYRPAIPPATTPPAGPARHQP